MRINDFGGFSMNSCIVDVQFNSETEVEHFFKAWTQKGKPDIKIDSNTSPFEQISIGTVVEHELRHYHDFLLSYVTIHNYWLKHQIFMNTMPMIIKILGSKELKGIVFPMLRWAETETQVRDAYLLDARGSDFDTKSVWQPVVIKGDPPKLDIIEPISMLDPDYETKVLWTIKKHFDIIDDVRGGIEVHGFDFKITPRLVLELSSLIVQVYAVRQTYGYSELELFVNKVMEDKSTYNSFFSMILVLFGKKSLPNFENKLIIFDFEDVDWRALSAAITWCLLGCAEDNELVHPARRLYLVIESALENYHQLFPNNMEVDEILDHLDTTFKTVPYKSSLKRSHQKLKQHFDRAEKKINRSVHSNDVQKACLEIFRGVYKDRERVIGKLLRSSKNYVYLGKYVSKLPWWPQCPIHLNFSRANVAFSVEELKMLGHKPYFGPSFGIVQEEGKEYVRAVMYSSFFPGRSSVKIEDVIKLQELRICSTF